MSALDKSPGVKGTVYRTIGPTALHDTDTKRLGGAAGTVTVPSGMDTLLGIWAHLDPSALADDESQAAWGYLDTEDGFNLKPFEFPFPVQGACGSTTTYTDSMRGEFYPVNCPVVPGGRINAYATAYEAAAQEPFCSVTYMFGKNIVLPKMLDDHPGRHRWRKIGHAATTTVAAGFQPEAQYQFTLSANGGAITEVGGIYWPTTQTVAAWAGGATMQVNSADVPVMPMEFNMNAFGAALAITSAHRSRDTITRRPCSAFGERVVHIDSQLVSFGGGAELTGLFVSMVEFVRRGE